MGIKECIEQGFLAKVKPSLDVIEKELKEATYDFERAQQALEEEDFKWCIVKAYYAMFHVAKAVLFALGLKERRHFAIGVVLGELNKRGKLEIKYVNDFMAAASSREDADYHYLYSKDIANHCLEIAKDFLDRMKMLLEDLKKEPVSFD